MEHKEGKLIICATPIGNLGDITYRVIEALKECDMIAAEDTRNSLKLCNHFDIKKPMTSYHEHNKYEKADTLIGMMREGKTIALISDAGTPAISDPGEVLVKRCHEEGIAVTSLPGACAAITALTLSGLSTRRFVFEGFLSSDKKEKKEVLENIKSETRTIVMYEAPHRLIKTLNELKESLGDRRLTICRELTKVHEEIIPISIDEAIEKYKSVDPRGEYVLVIEGKSYQEIREERESQFSDLSILEHLKIYEDRGMTQKLAMKQVAADLGITKRDVYRMVLEEKEGE